MIIKNNNKREWSVLLLDSKILSGRRGESLFVRFLPESSKKPADETATG